MESEWQHLQLGEFVRLQRGHDLTAGERTDGKYPVMGSAGPNGTHTEFKARGPGVVVGRSGASAGRVHYCPVDYWPHNTCLYVTDFLGNDPHFAYYYLGTLRLADYNSGSAQPSLNRNFIYTKPLLVPPPQAQREISHLLGSIDDRIDLLRETNTTLEAIAQALFKSWFVDFDPVRAKAEGREPIAMDAATAALFPSAFEASELGLIPKGWHPSSLGAVCSANGGLIQTGPFGSQLHASDYTADEGVPVVMPQDLASRRISVERISRVAEADAHRLAKHRLAAGDIVFSRRGDVGRHAMVADNDIGSLCGTGCLLVRPGQKRLISTFISSALARPESLEWLVRHAVGATMPNLNTSILSSLPIINVPELLMQAYGEIADPLEQRISLNQAQARSLAQLRDTLLPRLISGKLRLPEAEAAIESALDA